MAMFGIPSRHPTMGCWQHTSSGALDQTPYFRKDTLCWTESYPRADFGPDPENIRMILVKYAFAMSYERVQVLILTVEWE